jgi:lipopolysaccharide transport system permease protein
MALWNPNLPAPSVQEEPAAGVDAEQALPEILIEPRRGWQALGLVELWRFRELVYFLAWRDVKVRYKQTLLGAAWAILQPTLMAVVFALVLGGIAGVPSGNVPYPLFVYAGLLPWTLFATSITQAAQSVVSSERLLTKVYFPRLAVPLAAVAAALVDFVLAGAVLAGLMIYYAVEPGWSMLLAPAAVALVALAAMGVGTLLAALNVAYRDVRYLLPFLVQLWLFATPSIYMDPEAAARSRHTQRGEAVIDEPAGAPPRDRAQEGAARAAQWLRWNPLDGLVAFFRASALGLPLDWGRLAYSALMSPLMFLAGCLYFRRVEQTFADVI